MYKKYRVSLLSLALLSSELNASQNFENDILRISYQDVRRAIDNIRSGKIEIEKSITNLEALEYLKPIGIKLEKTLLLAENTVSKISFVQGLAQSTQSRKQQDFILLEEQYKTCLVNLLIISQTYLREVKQIKIDAMCMDVMENQNDGSLEDGDLNEKVIMLSRKFN
ncbi:MAG: hypothetical protein KBB83_00385 [Alphaproteobacteria bacterium]|nr:hypothetical protein [Alphaproteobacteria bacterium]